MLRRSAAFVLVMAVHLSAVTAPLTHVHLDDHETDHHDGRESHAHLTPHHQHALAAWLSDWDGPVMTKEEADERTIEASLFLVVRPDAVQLWVALPENPAIVIPDAVPVSRVPHVAHGPDPPDLVALAPRAPPSSLSLI